MATLSIARIADLLAPYASVNDALALKLSGYLDLLVRWNARTNLSAIREPEEMVRRHFGESLFAARHLPPGSTLLDFGSGAGLPGLPIALARPELRVTLAESQNKKAAFLREVVRTLKVDAEVWGARVEEMPRERSFDIVTMRSVDRPEQALKQAMQRVNPGGHIVHLTTAEPAGPAEPMEPADVRMPGQIVGIIRISQL